MPAPLRLDVFTVVVVSTKTDKAFRNSFPMLATDGETAGHDTERYLASMKYPDVKVEKVALHPDSAALQEQCRNSGGHGPRDLRCAICGYLSDTYRRGN
jgi:hypothetical protein